MTKLTFVKPKTFWMYMVGDFLLYFLYLVLVFLNVMFWHLSFTLPLFIDNFTKRIISKTQVSDVVRTCTTLGLTYWSTQDPLCRSYIFNWNINQPFSIVQCVPNSLHLGKSSALNQKNNIQSSHHHVRMLHLMHGVSGFFLDGNPLAGEQCVTHKFMTKV